MQWNRGLVYLLACRGLFITATAAAQPPPSHGFHPPMPDQEFFFFGRLEREAAPVDIEVPLQIPSPSARSELDQVIELPDPFGSVRVVEYLPRAAVEQSVAPDNGEGAGPAIELSIDGPKQAYRRWLLAADAERNRLTSFIGTWRYMAVSDKSQRDELYGQFVNELTRDPVLMIRPIDGDRVHQVPARAGEVSVLEALGCRVRVKRFFPDFAMDREGKEPVNQSERRLNPAALIEIEHRGKKEERWVFARFPDFSGKDGGEALPFRVRLDCPLDSRSPAPDFVLVTVGGQYHEVWARYAGKTTVEPLPVKRRIDIEGSNYTFRAERFIPSGRLVERYRAVEGKGGVPALRIETTDATGTSRPLWLEGGKQRVVRTAGASLMVSFGPRRPASHGGHE